MAEAVLTKVGVPSCSVVGDIRHPNWDRARGWCSRNTVGEWRYLGGGVFVFDSEREAVVFKLRWS